jgi:hypothetical protein
MSGEALANACDPKPMMLELPENGASDRINLNINH